MHGYEVTGPQLRCVLPFEAEPAELHVLRAAVREQLARWGIQAVADEVQLAVTELATNVIKHVGEGAAATLVMEPAEGRLRVELHDKSHEVPTTAQPECGDECGRGLHLVAAMAVDWGTILTATGKAVWCELATPLDASTGHTGGPRITRGDALLSLYGAGHRRNPTDTGPVAAAVAEEAAIDLIADLLHWLQAHGCDLGEALDRAQTHFEAEIAAG